MKTVLITGASRGIGKATAEKFLSEGWNVIGTSTSGKSTLKGIKMHKLNVSSPENIVEFVKALNNDNEKIDVLVNNAGIQTDSSDHAIKIDELRKTLEVNLIGLIDLTQRVIPLMNKGGHIINVSSALGGLNDFFGVSSPSYQISKAGLNMYTKILAEWLKDKNIIVSSMNPGWVKTDLGGMNAFREPQEPAEEIFQLATSNIDTGYFWFQGKKRNW